MRRPRSRLGSLVVLAMLATLLPLGVSPAVATTGDLVITGVVDGPLSGGVPKAVELYAVNDIPDLSIYGVSSANNGGGTTGSPEYTFPADSAAAGDFIYLATEADGFTAFFGFAPDYTHGQATNVNGDDAIELFMNGSVVDVFGEVDLDGTGQPWEYMDGWAYRLDGSGQDGAVFSVDNWRFSGPNALDGETSNATAATPFPLGSYSTEEPPTTPDIVINEIMQNPSAVSDSAGEWLELYNPGTTDVDVNGWTLSDNDTDSHTIDNGGPLVVPAGGYTVLGANTDGAANGGAAVDYAWSSYFLANGADEVVLTDDHGVEVDRVEYDDGATFPDPAGASMSLEDPGLDNNVGANWCASVTSFGDGDLGTPGAENVCTLPPVEAKIHDIQGTGLASPMVGQTVIIEGVVVGDFQGSDHLNGFFVQEEDDDTDADPNTSEGIFVFDGSNPATDVAVGDLVTVTGTVSEFFNLTEIGSVTDVTVESSGNSVASSTVSLPMASDTDFEKYEGMAVTIPQTLYISEFFNFDRFGEIVLTGQRQFQPTAIFDPDDPRTAQQVVDNTLDRITVDDGTNAENPDHSLHPDGMDFTLDNRFRAGDEVANVTGVMDYEFGLYRIQPTAGADYTVANPRPTDPPSVGGRLKVATFNVLNYFSTLDDGTPICGPVGGLECRGADNAEEFTRQRDKIITAITALDADVVGLMEIENNPDDEALIDLVDGLNDATSPGTYDYIGTGAIGTDAIRIAIIYKPVSVSPVGADAVLDSQEFVNPMSADVDKNRPAQAQTFMENTTGEVFTVVVNHLKSKGSSCGAGDDDPLQGNCNATRTKAAKVLADWLATDPTGSGDSDFMIIGDLNSYDHEDPIAALRTGADDTAGTGDDFTDLDRLYGGEEAYSYLFDGQLGYLDYALADQSLADQVTGAGVWHINADEPDILDYDTTFKSDYQDGLYESNAFRSSDHDPVVVGLSLDQTPPEVEANIETLAAGRRTGLFKVDYSCDDIVDPSPTCVADINGIDVGDGQRVFLIEAGGRALHFRVLGVLFIKARSFELTVTGTDASGNSATASDQPDFR